jgi:hypothetical protein
MASPLTKVAVRMGGGLPVAGTLGSVAERSLAVQTKIPNFRDMATDQPTRAFAVPDQGHRSLGSGVEGAGEWCAAPAFFVIPVLESVRFFICARWS